MVDLNRAVVKLARARTAQARARLNRASSRAPEPRKLARAP
jgi:hypothetical protein